MRRIIYIFLIQIMLFNMSYTDVYAYEGAASCDRPAVSYGKQAVSCDQRAVATLSAGKKRTGWHKIKNKYYYFDKKGRLQKNKIVGSKKSGYYYVDRNGIRITDKNIRYAVKFVMRYSSSKDQPEKRLKSCFKALCKYRYRQSHLDKPSAKKMKSYAADMFGHKRGNCYRYASAFAYIARVLGYDSSVSVGGVTAFAHRKLSPHGWTEVKINGKWMICDCSMQNAHKKNRLFLVEKKKYPFRLRCDNRYVMDVKKGKVSWK